MTTHRSPWPAASGRDDAGFTLIELLVVILIIGVLAAIAIPTFLSQRAKGWVAAAKSELRNAALAQETYFTEDQGGPGVTVYAPTVAALETAGFHNSTSIVMTVATVDTPGSQSYCMSARHVRDDAAWYITSLGGEPSLVPC